MRLVGIGLATIAMAVAIGMTYAAERVVYQEDKTFHPEVLQAKVGDTMVFVNNDRFNHNLYSDTPGFKFNIRKQRPGESDSIILEQAGEFEVRCRIHPRMEMKVIVK